MVVTYTTHKRCMSLSMFATRVTTVYSANYVILAKPIEKLLSTQSKNVASCKQLLAAEKAMTFNNTDNHMLEYILQLHHNTLTHEENS